MIGKHNRSVYNTALMTISAPVAQAPQSLCELLLTPLRLCLRAGYAPNIVLTPGDPLGVGPEIAVHLSHAWVNALTALQTEYPEEEGFLPTLTLMGSLQALAHAAGYLNKPLPETSSVLQYEDISVSNVGREAQAGKIAYQAIEAAVAGIGKKRFDLLVTGPINKYHLKQAGVLASGHTELLYYFGRAFLPQWPARCTQSDMLFVYHGFRVLLLTRHVPLSQVGKTLTPTGVQQSLENLVHYLQMQQGIAVPRIAMLGVNPHAGEVGGHEEQDILVPSIGRLNASGKAVLTLPMPADAVFRGLDLEQLPYDAYVASYHDQGLVPMKLVAGYQAVNVTLGLPFIRTSVSHGTADDIAGQGIAQPESLALALKEALIMGLAEWQQANASAHLDSVPVLLQG